MKFKKYLTETVTFDGIVTTLEQDCSKFIKDWKKLRTIKWLMSGRKGNYTFEKRNTRKDRKPVDMHPDAHKWMDDWFNKKFGVKARSNSIFCSFNPNLSDNFGRLHLIFPIGDYKAITSDKVEDAYGVFTSAVLDILEKSYFRLRWNEEVSDEDKEKIKKVVIDELNRSKYTDKLTFNNNEVMLVCNSYYIVSSSYNGQLLDYFENKI